MNSAWTMAIGTTERRVHWLIFFWPAAPSFWMASMAGDTLVNIEKMIDAEM